MKEEKKFFTWVPHRENVIDLYVVAESPAVIKLLGTKISSVSV